MTYMAAGSYSPGSIHSAGSEEMREAKGAAPMADAQGAAARSAEWSALNPPTLQATAGAPVRLLLQLYDKLGLPTRLRAGRPVLLCHAEDGWAARAPSVWLWWSLVGP